MNVVQLSICPNTRARMKYADALIKAQKEHLLSPALSSVAGCNVIYFHNYFLINYDIEV